MTRCYEFYAMFKKTPKRCEISDRSSLWRVDKYMEKFEEKGVKFDYSEDDKDLFYELHDDIGSEYKVGRVGDHQRRVECSNCHMGTDKAVTINGEFYCPSCASETKFKARPQRTEKREYKPKLSWPERKELMHPKISKMEEAIRLRLEEKGIRFQAQTEFCLQATRPDFYFPNENLAVYLDGEKVHQKREAKDEFLREKLQKHHNIRAIGIVYKDNSKKSEDEIFEKIVSVLQEAENYE